MMCNRIALLDLCLDLVPRGFCKLRLMKDVEELVRLSHIQVKTVAADKFQRVPGFRIVTRCDRDSAVCFEPLDCQLQARGWTHIGIDHSAAASQETRQDGGANHRTRGSRVAADQYAAGIQVGAKSLCEAYDQLGREGFAYDTAHSADPNL